MWCWRHQVLKLQAANINSCCRSCWAPLWSFGLMKIVSIPFPLCAMPYTTFVHETLPFILLLIFKSAWICCPNNYFKIIVIFVCLEASSCMLNDELLELRNEFTLNYTLLIRMIIIGKSFLHVIWKFSTVVPIAVYLCLETGIALYKWFNRD